MAKVNLQLRNKGIIAWRDKGKAYQWIADKHNLSYARVRQICIANAESTKRRPKGRKSA